MSVSADLGVRLRQGRERKGFTVRGLARYVGVSPSLVSQIERGKVMPSVGTLYTIANQLTPTTRRTCAVWEAARLDVSRGHSCDSPLTGCNLQVDS